VKKKSTFIPQGKNDNNVTVKIKNYMRNFSALDNPDTEHTVHLGGCRTVKPVPIEKTEDEIERMHLYNAMMGRR
jgi:hypothetical protein